MTIDELKNLAKTHGWEYNGRIGTTHQFLRISNGTDTATTRFEVNEGCKDPCRPDTTDMVVSIYHLGRFRALRDAGTGPFESWVREVVTS